MSAGRFEIGRYEIDAGTIIPIRVQEETKALTIEGVANDYPAGAATRDFGSARVGGGERQIGLRARGVTIRFQPGAEPAGYKPESPIRLPWFAPATHAAIADGNTGTYLGAAITVVSPYDEERN